MTWRDRNRNGGNNNGGGANKLPAFQPGQLGALAQQLNAGFGGGVQDWKADLRNTYDPTSMRGFNFGGGNGGGNGNQQGGNNGNNGGNGGNQGGFDPSRPRNMAMPAMPMRPMQIPQQGLLSAQMPQQQRGLLGDMPPEVLAFLNTRR